VLFRSCDDYELRRSGDLQHREYYNGDKRERSGTPNAAVREALISSSQVLGEELRCRPHWRGDGS
jgi:hypothetical protein